MAIDVNYIEGLNSEKQITIRSFFSSETMVDFISHHVNWLRDELAGLEQTDDEEEKGFIKRHQSLKQQKEVWDGLLLFAEQQIKSAKELSGE